MSVCFVCGTLPTLPLCVFFFFFCGTVCLAVVCIHPVELAMVPCTEYQLLPKVHIFEFFCKSMSNLLS